MRTGSCFTTPRQPVTGVGSLRAAKLVREASEWTLLGTWHATWPSSSASLRQLSKVRRKCEWPYEWWLTWSESTQSSSLEQENRNRQRPRDDVERGAVWEASKLRERQASGWTSSTCCTPSAEIIGASLVLEGSCSFGQRKNESDDASFQMKLRLPRSGTGCRTTAAWP